jgi:hypothetical protein
MATINWLELAYLQHQVEEELELQRRIVIARDLYEGTLAESLVAELRAGLLAGEADDIESLFNVYAATVDEIADRLSVEAFWDGPDPATAAPVEWASHYWQTAHLDELQHEVMLNALIDGESFVILEPSVDHRTGEVTIKAYPHERYTDAQVGGTNEGVKMHYKSNKRPGMGWDMASKRWPETVIVNGERETRQRMTLYIPADGEEDGRIEKYIADGDQWLQHQDEGDEGWPLPWAYHSVIGFRNTNKRRQGSRATGAQAVLDNLITALSTSASTMAAPSAVVMGGYPTDDGKPAAEDGSNVWRMGPRRIIGFPDKTPQEASVKFERPGDLSQLLHAIDHVIKLTAVTTSTPSLTAKELGHNVAGETLKQLDIRPTAVARRVQNAFGNSWTRLFKEVALMHNDLATGESVPDDTAVHVSWLPADIRGHQPIHTVDESQAGEDVAQGESVDAPSE